MNIWRYLYLRTPESLQRWFPSRKWTAGVTSALVSFVVLGVLQQAGVEVDAAVPFLNLIAEQEMTYRQLASTLAAAVGFYVTNDSKPELLAGEPPEDHDGMTTLGTDTEADERDWGF